jgi:ABC-type transport system substrate-binding protein/DNA-binding SARP family transcriptional activator
VEFGVLGPVRASDDGREVRLGGPKQRSLLAILLLHANEVVARDRLIDGIWGERPPPSVGHTLDDYISRLRKALGGGRLTRTPPGYVLIVSSEELDLERFERLLREGREALAGGDPTSAEARLRQGLALWRGPALADVMDEPFAKSERGYLEERRLVALEARIEAELALGRSSELVSELEALVAEHPFRERLISQLMLALYRSGRQAEALAVARAARLRLAEELGLEPGPEFRALETAIFEHHRSLDSPTVPAPRDSPPPPTAPPGPRIGRARLVMIAGIVAVAAVASILVAWPGHESRRLAAAPNSVGIVDMRAGELSAVVHAGGQPGGIAAGAGAVWETDTSDDLLLEIDPQRRTIERIPVGRGPTGVAVGGGEVWVVNQIDRTVSAINPQALTPVGSFRVGSGADAVAFGDGSLWVANATDSTVSRINPDTGSVATIALSGTPAGIAVGHEGVWVTCASTGQLLLIDPRSNKVTQAVGIGNGPAGVAVGAGSVWVANTPEGTVSRFDPSSGAINKINVGRAPDGVAQGGGAVWIANSLDGTIARIDPATNSVRQVRVGNEPTALATTGRSVWSTVLAGPASHRGGTVTVVEGPPLLSVGAPVDPARFAGVSQWQMLSMTNDGLVTYRRASGLAGSTLVPDLTTTLPTPTDDGRTYTFQLRSGIHYSTGAPVKPEDFRRAIERTFMLGDGYAQSFYIGISGAHQCEQARTRCSLNHGIVANDDTNTVTFHLTAPDPDFLYKLAFPMADAIPADTPGHPLAATAIPATGPYKTQSVSRSRVKFGGRTLSFGTWILVRNPRFHQWSPYAQPDGYPGRIVLTQTPDPRPTVSQVENGSVDVLLAPQPASLKKFARRYASQLHSEPLAATFALVMNTRAAPFDRLAVRQALNYAIDRSQIASFAGGPRAAQPTCQILPPTLSGYQPYCPYTIRPNASGPWTAPNLAKAEQLVSASGTRGMRVNLWLPPPDATDPTDKIGRYISSILDQLGYRATRTFSTNPTAGPIADSRTHGQIGWFTWYSDYLAPSGFIDPLLTCPSFLPHDPSNLNLAEFCNLNIDTQVQRARALQAPQPGASSRIWAQVDHELTDQAAWLPLYTPQIPAALSAHVGDYEYHPFWRLLLDQLWVR